MRKLLLMLLFLKLALADVIITEVMYNPNQCNDTDCEWIEIYNNGNNNINLENYTLNGDDFDDAIINAKEYLVVARNFAGFEEFFGNNDTLWNESDGFNAVDGSFSLRNSGDIIILKEGSYEDVLNYSNILGGDGNGKTIEKIDLGKNNSLENWNESSDIGGSPGKGDEESNGINVEFNITNVKPEILEINLPNQVLPNSIVNVTAVVRDVNGVDDITDVRIVFNDEASMFKVNDLDNETAEFAGSFQLLNEERGNVTIKAFDLEGFTANVTSINVLSVISINLNTDKLDFGNIVPGTSSDEEIITIENNGNVLIDIEMFSSDFVSDKDVIRAENLEVFNNGWSKLLTSNKLLDINIENGDAKEIPIRMNVPTGIRSSNYRGAIGIIAVK